MLILIGVIFGVFLVTGVPVAFALALACIPAFVISGTMPPTIILQKMAVATQSFPLLAVPFFIFAGNLLNATGITERLVRFSTLLTGWMAGGLAQISVALSFMLGGVSGSAVADASMEARLFGKTMQERGYSKGFSAAVIAFSSIITATIPPSIGLILFGFINEVSIGRLLLGGILPGTILTGILMAITGVVAKRYGYGAELETLPTARALWKSFRECIWALMFPIILIAGFRFGIFTATEAGAFLVFYSLFIGLFVYRELTFAKLIDAFRGTMDDLGMVMLLIIMAAVLGYAVTLERAPQQLALLITSLTEDRYFILFLVVALLIVTGMVLEAAANILLVTPIVLPVLVAHGFDPIHMGVLMITVINFGGLTPPVGVIMFTVCGILRCSVAEFTRSGLPFFAGMIVLFILMAAFPGVVLLLPNALM
jgi:TRAP-type transport system large permease protein